MYLDVDARHTNPDSGGFCCPHCLKTGYDGYAEEDEWREVKCSECGEPFAVRRVPVIENESGVIEARHVD